MLMGLPGLLWVSIGFYEIVGLLDRWRTHITISPFKRSKNGTAVLTMGIICAIILPSTLSWSGADKSELKKAGLYLKETGYSHRKLAVESRLNRLGFYSEAEYATIPDNIKPSEIPAFLRSTGADYLIIDERTMGRPVALFVENAENNSLKRINVKEFDAYRNYSFTLFSIGKHERGLPRS